MFLKLASDNMIRLHGMKMTVSVSVHEFKCKDGFKPQRLYVARNIWIYSIPIQSEVHVMFTGLTSLMTLEFVLSYDHNWMKRLSVTATQPPVTCFCTM